MLNTLAVDNIAIGKHINIPNLGRVNLIVGKNGCGKTDFLNTIDGVWWHGINDLNESRRYSGHRIDRLVKRVAYARGRVLLVDGIEDGLHHSIMDTMWTQLFAAAQRYNVQIFATTHSRDAVESFSRVLSTNRDIGGILIRLGISVKASNKGEIIATRFDADELRDCICAGIEVR